LNLNFFKLKQRNKNPFSVYNKENNEDLEITNKSIKKFLKDNFGCIDFSYLTVYSHDESRSDNIIDDDDETNSDTSGTYSTTSSTPVYTYDDYDGESIDEYHEFYLFIWCILTNKLEIAKSFWRLGKVCFQIFFFCLK
jgi:hypothetical protein